MPECTVRTNERSFPGGTQRIDGLSDDIEGVAQLRTSVSIPRCHLEIQPHAGAGVLKS